MRGFSFFEIWFFFKDPILHLTELPQSKSHHSFGTLVLVISWKETFEVLLVLLLLLLVPVVNHLVVFGAADRNGFFLWICGYGRSSSTNRNEPEPSDFSFLRLPFFLQKCECVSVSSWREGKVWWQSVNSILEFLGWGGMNWRVSFLLSLLVAVASGAWWP